MAVPAHHNLPVAVGNTGTENRTARSVLRGVVLSASNDVVEGPVIVRGHLVELRQGQLAEEVIRPTPVMGAVQSSVAADQQEVRIQRVEGHGVVVHMLAGISHRLPGTAPVFGTPQAHIGMVEHIESMGITEQFLIVVRACTAACVVTPLFPALTAVLGAPDPTLGAGQFNGRVHHLGLLRRHSQRNLALVASGQPTLEFMPRLPCIR